MNQAEVMDLETTQIDAGVFEFSMVTITAPQKYGKAFSLDALGKLQKTVIGSHERGTVRRHRVDMNGLLMLLVGAKPGQHITAGTPDIEIDAAVPLASESQAQPGDLTRTKGSFPFRPRPGLMVIDCDMHGDDDHLQDQILSACPAFSEAPAIIRSSSSSCIYNEETGEELAPTKSLHVFVPVTDASDIPRALQALHERLWLAGHGTVIISKTGKAMLRSPVDLALQNPAQPVFLRAHMGPGLKQKPACWNLPAGEDSCLDTQASLPDLTAEERSRMEEMQANAMLDMAEAMADATKAYTERRVKEFVDRDGITADRAHQLCKAALERCDLYGDWTLPLSDGRVITVAEILRDPAKYHGVTCRDPLEHEYGGPSVAMIFSDQAKPTINSNAHGGTVYFLKPHTEAQIKKMSDAVLKRPQCDEAASAERLAKEATIEILSKWFVTEEQVMKMKQTQFIWKAVIASAHLSVWAAPGNGGKTTLAKLAAADLAADGFKVMFFQEDAGAGDLPALHAHAQEHGYNLLNSTLAGGSPDEQVEALKSLAKADIDLNQYVFILDTLKKFADLMSKGGSREFFKLMRALTQRGATVVLLGHTNKHRGVDGKLIFEGVGDIRNDVDELFYLESIENPPRVVTITMTPDKVRSAAQQASFQLNRDTMVIRSLDDVVNVKAILGREQQMKEDDNVIRLIESAITPIGLPYTKVVDAVTGQSNFGARTVRAVIDRYVSADPADEKALWIETTMRVNNVRLISRKPQAAPPL